MFELVKMWMLVEALGLLCLPLSVTVFHNLPDRGWAFSKSLGMAVFAFAVWLPLMCFRTLPYSQPFLWGVGLVLAGGSIVGFWLTHRTVEKVFRRNASYVILTEIVFLGMVVLLGVLRQFRPDIRSWETFMDEGIIAGIMRSPHLPPNDVWYAGSSINYYYYAHFTVATLGKMIGQSPSIVFNTAISIFFGLTAVNIFGVTSNIVAWAKYVRSGRKTQQDEMLQPAQTVEPASQSFPPLPGAMPYGLCSMVMGVVFGNLAAAGQWWTEVKASASVYDWFSPSRVIPSTINEFPAFSFLLSDFHAHVLTLAFTILAIAVAFNLFLEHDGISLKAFGHGWQQPLTLFASALILGQLFAMNGWDLPTYLGLALVVIALQQWFAYKQRLQTAYVVDVVLTWITLIALTVLLFLPFYMNYIVPVGGIRLVKPEDRSAFSSELLIYGFFLFVFVSLLISSVWRQPLGQRHRVSPGAADSEETDAEDGNERRTGEEEGRKQFSRFLLPGLTGVLLLNIVILLLLRNSQTFVVMGDITLVSVGLLWYHKEDRALAFTLLLGALAFALVAGCEIVYLRDLFEASYPRMNTVFKFYFQAWILFSLACGSGLFFIVEQLWQGNGDVEGQVRRTAHWSRGGITISWVACLALLVLASLVYPLKAPSARLSTYNTQTHAMSMNPSWNLDGMAYLQNCRPPDIYPDMESDPNSVPFCQYDVTHDYAAIRWINAHIEGDPVIVEAANVSNEDYSLYALVSSFTGLPTIMGWPGHEVQWRNGWLQNPGNAGLFNQRLSDINTMYTSPTPQVVVNLMHYYHAEYLYVGAIEHVAYPQADLTRFASFMQTVYSQEGVAIYKIRD